MPAGGMGRQIESRWWVVSVVPEQYGGVADAHGMRRQTIHWIARARGKAVVTWFAQSSFATGPLNADVHALRGTADSAKGQLKRFGVASSITYVSKGDPPFCQILGDKDDTFL